jgi:hypothetical protein
VNDTSSEIRIECDLPAELPIAQDEVKLLQELLPDLVKEMVWAQPEE